MGQSRTGQRGPEGRGRGLGCKQSAYPEQRGGRSQGESGPGDTLHILEKNVGTHTQLKSCGHKSGGGGGVGGVRDRLGVRNR